MHFSLPIFSIYVSVIFVLCTDEQVSIEITINGDQTNIPRQYGRIALLYALELEAEPVIDNYNMKKTNHLASINDKMNPMNVYSNSNQTIFVICNGNDRNFNVPRIGTQAAAINAFLTIQYIKPDLIISIGIAGAINNEIKGEKISIGDVFIAERVMYHDRRIGVSPWSDGWSIGMYETVNLNVDIKSIDGLKKEYVLVSTGNAFPEVKEDHDMWTIHGAHLSDMEAAAIAEVCIEKSVPFTAIKGVSNFVRDDGVGEFEEHLKMSVNKLGTTVCSIIDALFI